MLPDGWKRMPLGDIAQVTSGGTPERSKPGYWNGDIPWVTTGEIQFNVITDTVERISAEGLRNSAAKLFPPGTLLMAMYGQGRTRGQVARLGITAATNQACAAILLKDGYDDAFYYQCLRAQYDVIRAIGNAGTQKNLNTTLIRNIPVPVPPLDEQRYIARLAETWDQAIAATEALVVNRRRQKRALAQQLLSGKRRLRSFAQSAERIPTRFGSLPADWPHVPIESVASEVSVKNQETMPLPVLSCTKHAGLVDAARYFKKRVHSEDTSAYKMVERGCFAYATNHIDEGSIGYQDLYETALISPMYTVFKVSENIDDGYLYKVLKTDHYRQIFSANTNASVDRRGSLRWRDFEKIEIPVPALEEQAAISSIINSAEREIGNLVAQLAVLRDEKKALMHQILSGKRQVPRVGVKVAA